MRPHPACYGAIKPRGIYLTRAVPVQIPRRFPLPPSFGQARHGFSRPYSLQLDHTFRSPNSQTLSPDSVRQDFLIALQEGNSHKLLSAFLTASQDETFLQSIPSTTVAEILRIIDLSHFLNKYKAIYRDMHHLQISYLGHGTLQLNEIFHKYAGFTQLLLSRWRDSGRRFGIHEYKILFNLARAVGNGEMALRVMKAMRDDGLEPDTMCYNYYLEARCWSNCYDPLERRRLRVYSYNLAMRKSSESNSAPREGFKGHRVGEDGGLRREVIETFDHMVQSGLTADVHTFSMLIQALGREGDMEGVKRILRQIWDIDLDIILHQDDTPLLLEHNLRSASPLFPNQTLLFTLVHTFAINNMLPAALRVVDFVSRKYSIPINTDIWTHLLEWTFVLSHRRYGPNKSEAEIDQLPLASVENLWNTMTSEPYRVQPTMSMYNFRVLTLLKRQMIGPTLDAMRKGRGLSRMMRKKFFKLHRANDGYQGSDSTGEFYQAAETPLGFSERQEAYEVARMTVHRDFLMISRWVRLLLAGNRWYGHHGRNFEWERVGVPDVIEKFWRYRPWTGFGYNTATGRVQFHHKCEKTVVVHLNSSSLAGMFVAWGTEACTELPYEVATRYSKSLKKGYPSNTQPPWYQKPITRE